MSVSAPVIDLHTHSNRSDGTDTPTQLVRKAKDAAITVLAITDHDTTAGWAEASDAAEKYGIELVRGIELTVKNGDQSQHLLAYEPDADDPALQAMLASNIEARDDRIPKMIELINKEKRGAGLRLEDVQAAAAGATPGRPHIADVLVNLGHFKDRREAFAAYLVPGLPTYVPRWAPTLDEAIRVVRNAGGVTVIAHPWGRKTHIEKSRFG